MSFTKSFTSKQLSKLQTINQPVVIKEMIISFEDTAGSFGEYSSKIKGQDSVVNRLVKHIKMIAKIANQYHESQHYHFEDNSMKLNPEAKNHITRVLLNEYAFYTNKEGRPLTLKEFSSLLDKIEIIAKNQHPNLHLLLGTFSVIGNDSKLLNMSLYIECGKNSQIHSFVKSHSSVGTEYKGYRDFDRKNTRADIDEPVMASIPLDSKQTVNLESIFICTTQGRAQFIVAIDICLDHSKSHSKVAFENLLNSPISDLLPTQISQVIISNTATIDPDKLITPCVSHADAKSISVSVDNKPIDPIQLKNMPDFKNDSLPTTIEISNNQIKVNQPIFGSNYAFNVYNIPLTQNSSPLYKSTSKRIYDVNQNFIQEKIKRIYLHNSTLDLEHQFIEAVKRGELHIIRKFLEQKQYIKSIEEQEISLLHLAIQFRQSNLLLPLLENKANPSLLNEQKHSVMYQAANQSDINSLAVLLKAGVPWDIEDQTISLHSLILDAIKANNVGAFKELFKVFHQQNGNINALHKHGYTLLHRAVEIGNKTIIDTLINHSKINLNQPDRFHKSALFNAIKLKQASTIKSLLDHKANINLDAGINKNVILDQKIAFQPINNRPIFAAINSKDITILAILIKNESLELNEPDSEHGITPLLYALHLMLDKAVQPNSSSNEIEKILHIVNLLKTKNAHLLGYSNTALQDKKYIGLLASKLEILNNQIIDSELKLFIKDFCESAIHSYHFENAIRNKKKHDILDIITGYKELYGIDKTRIFVENMQAICNTKYSINIDASSLLATGSQPKLF